MSRRLDIQGMFFDLDGTLYDPGPVRRRMAMRLVLAHIIRPVRGYANAKVLSAYRHALETLRSENSEVLGPDIQIGVCCRMTGLCDTEVRACIREWFEEKPLDLLRRSMRPGLVELLETARSKGIRLGVLSDYPVRAKLRAMGIEQYFEVAICPHDYGIGRLKPDPAGLRFIFDQLHIHPGAAIYVGDRPEVDAEAAQRAGTRACIVGSSGDAPAGASWMAVRDFFELSSLI